eukprot:GILI01037222.1.p1 GENE.GILI01037222.1~~GILI01037222.1.p1  ORF type:complete len:132 (+),score=6.32 GILI01037222.1:36-431(+)
MSKGSVFFERKDVNLGDVANTPTKILEHNGGRKQVSGSQSVSSSVPRWKKNPFVFRIVERYMRLPTGPREFSIVGPLVVLALGLSFWSHKVFPVEGALTENPEATNFKGYTLEPIYGDRGQVTGYRRVNTE